jgi:hypothetical protein
MLPSSVTIVDPATATAARSTVSRALSLVSIASGSLSSFLAAIPGTTSCVAPVCSTRQLAFLVDTYVVFFNGSYRTVYIRWHKRYFASYNRVGHNKETKWFKQQQNERRLLVTYAEYLEIMQAVKSQRRALHATCFFLSIPSSFARKCKRSGPIGRRR